MHQLRPLARRPRRPQTSSRPSAQTIYVHKRPLSAVRWSALRVRRIVVLSAARCTAARLQKRTRGKTKPSRRCVSLSTAACNTNSSICKDMASSSSPSIAAYVSIISKDTKARTPNILRSTAEGKHTRGGDVLVATPSAPQVLCTGYDAQADQDKQYLFAQCCQSLRRFRNLGGLLAGYGAQYNMNLGPKLRTCRTPGAQPLVVPRSRRSASCALLL